MIYGSGIHDGKEGRPCVHEVFKSLGSTHYLYGQRMKSFLP